MITKKTMFGPRLGANLYLRIDIVENHCLGYEPHMFLVLLRISYRWKLH